jgi:outer membrane immunogenic protein
MASFKSVSAITAAVGAVLLGGAALAADMPLKAPPPPVVVYNWTGCYGGVNVGWKEGRFRDESVDVPLTTGPVGNLGTFTVPADHINLDRVRGDSAVGGVQAGCRWETTNHWVFGAEGDFDFADLKGRTLNRFPGTVGGVTFVPGDTFDNRMRWESSVRAIAGRAFDRFLIYVTGGVAFAEVSMGANFIPTIGVLTNGRAGLYPGSFGSETNVLTGGTVGAGIAYLLSKNFEIGAEYRYTRYASGDFSVGQVAGLCGITTQGTVCLNQTAIGHKALETNEVLFKASYRFNAAPAAVVAKY